MACAPKALIATVLLFVTCVLYSINYDIHDIDSYFLLAYVTLSLWVGFGLRSVGEWLVAKTGWRRTLVALILILAGMFPIVGNLSRVSQKGELSR